MDLPDQCAIALDNFSHRKGLDRLRAFGQLLLRFGEFGQFRPKLGPRICQKCGQKLRGGHSSVPVGALRVLGDQREELSDCLRKLIELDLSIEIKNGK